MINERSFLKAVVGAFAISMGGVLAGGAAAEDAVVSGEYTADYKHRYITFSYDYVGFMRPNLQWSDWDATLDWNGDDPAASSVSVTIDAASIDSGVEEFDGHLRSADFFDVENHPTITFVSTALDATGDNEGTVTGDLTIKGITKPVTLNVKMNNAGFDQRNNAHRIGFSATGVVKRSDFGVGQYAPAISDDVDLSIEAVFARPVEAE